MALSFHRCVKVRFIEPWVRMHASNCSVLVIITPVFEHDCLITGLQGALFTAAPMLTKLEAVTSSAVRAAEKASAKLIIVFTDTGLTASLVAKYRPNVPILTLVVPRLVNDNMKWRLTGKNVAKQCLLTRGLVPMLAIPSPDGGKVLQDAIAAAVSMNLVKPYDHVVCVEKVHGDYCIKMVSVDAAGRGILNVEAAHVAGTFGSPTRRRDTTAM